MKKILYEKSIPKPAYFLILLLIVINFLLFGGMTILKTGIFYSIVSGSSMEKTLSNGTKLLSVNDEFIGIKRGNIVSVLVYDDGKKINIIKRVIALPNETIHIEGSKVYINGNLLKEPYAYYSEPSKDALTITLHDNEYFVMGDNRLHSTDSRELGPAPKKNILDVIIKTKKPNK